MDQGTDEITTSDTVASSRHFDAAVGRVFGVIADSVEHSAMTGAPAEISPNVGGAFTTHGGAIEGRVLERVDDRYLVKAWRPADWPEGVYSIVRYDFAETDGGTTLTVTHSAIPDGAAEHLAEGWRTMYWGPLATYLAN